MYSHSIMRVHFGIIVLILCLWKQTFSSDVKYIPESWVDPNDMRNYDRYSKSMKTNPTSKVDGVCKNDLPTISPTDHELSNLRNEVERYQIFIERFINQILVTADLKDKIPKPGTKITTKIPILITSEELESLVTLSRIISSSQLNKLDALLSKVMTDERGFSFNILTPYVNLLEELFYNLTLEKVTVITFILICGIVLWMFAVGKALRRIIVFIFLTVFMAGLGWNWWNMYQDATIEQYAEQAKFSAIPDVCIPKKSSFFSYFFSSSSDYDCEKYHKAFRANAFAKIPPTVVFSETISSMFVHPLKNMGSAVGAFLVGINSAASWPLRIIFLPFVFITLLGFLLVILMLSLGVNLKFWTFFGGLTISGVGDDKRHNNFDHRPITKETDLRLTVEQENDDSFVLARVGTIKSFIQENKHENKQIGYSEAERRCDRLVLSENKHEKKQIGYSDAERSCGRLVLPTTEYKEKAKENYGSVPFDNSKSSNADAERSYDRLVIPTTEYKEKAKENYSSVPFDNSESSNAIMELCKYIPKRKIQSFKALRQRSAVIKKKRDT